MEPVPELGRALGRALVQELEPVLARELERVQALEPVPERVRELERVQALEPVRVVARELEPERVSQRRAREVARVLLEPQEPAFWWVLDP